MKFPRLFQLMNSQSNPQNQPLFESELCEGQKVNISIFSKTFDSVIILTYLKPITSTRQDGEESLLKKIQQWLNEIPIKSIGRQSCGTESLSRQSIEQVVKTVESLEVS